MSFRLVQKSVTLNDLQRHDGRYFALFQRISVSVRGRTPTLLHGPGCNLAAWWRLPPSCAQLGGFAIGAQVALLWQHNANPSYKLASIPRYDDIVRTAVWAGSAHAAGR